MIERSCKSCKKIFMAKSADVKRGWAKCCSKSCAASTTNQKTGNFARFIQGAFSQGASGDHEVIECAGRDAMEDGWDGHKNAF